MSIRRAALALAAAALMATSMTTLARAADPAPAAPALKAAQSDKKPIIKRFDTWSTRCQEEEDAKGKMSCHAFVDVRAGDEKRQILYFGVGYVPNKKDELFAFAMTPLGSILTPGVGVSIDDKEKFGGPYAFCLPMGCQAEIKLTDEQIKALKSGKTMEVMFRLMGQGVVKIPVDLKGFSAAIASLPKS
jgi:invasion protein IalB